MEVDFMDKAPGWDCKLSHVGKIKTSVIPYHLAGSDD